MRAFKAFNKDMTCTLGKGRYQYRIGGTYLEDRAQAHQTGFHAAEYILDCLSYYNFNSCRICEVEAAGDIDEDGSNTKIACTNLTILRELSKEEVILEAMRYLAHHPRFKDPEYVTRNEGKANKGLIIVRGKHPAAAGREGDILGLMEERGGKLKAVAIYTVGRGEIEPGVYYDIDGKEVKKGAEKSRFKKVTGH